MISILLISLFTVLALSFLGGQIDLSFMEDEARKYWNRRYGLKNLLSSYRTRVEQVSGGDEYLDETGKGSTKFTAGRLSRPAET